MLKVIKHYYIKDYRRSGAYMFVKGGGKKERICGENTGEAKDPGSSGSRPGLQGSIQKQHMKSLWLGTRAPKVKLKCQAPRRHIYNHLRFSKLYIKTCPLFPVFPATVKESQKYSNNTIYILLFTTLEDYTMNCRSNNVIKLAKLIFSTFWKVLECSE